MSLKRYTQPRRTFSLYIPKKPLSVILQHKMQSSLPHLTINSTNDTKKDSIPIIPRTNSFNANIKGSYKPVVDNEVSKFISISANRNIIINDVYVCQQFPLPSPKNPDFTKILLENIKICYIIFNFDQPESQLSCKKIKTNVLNELITLMTKGSESSIFSNQVQEAIYNMIMKNVFDQDPYVAFESTNLSTITWDFIESSWPHLNLVYQILIRFVILYPERCKIDLIHKAIRLLNIPDKKECESLISFVKTYTSIHSEQLNEIWHILKNALINVLSNIYTPYCVDPILCLISSLINQSSVDTILRTHLLPLYCHEQLCLYSKPLTDLVFKIVDNNVWDQVDAINFLISHFPHQCGQKQFLFITAINSILDILFDSELNEIAPKLISFLKYTIRLPNAKLVESSIKLLLKPTMTSILFRNASLAIDLLYEPLKSISSTFWDSGIKAISKKALTTLVNISYEVKKNGPVSNSVNTSRLPMMNNNSSCQHIIATEKKSDNSELVAKWALVARSASRKDESIDLTKSLLHIQVNLLNEKNVT